MGLFNFFTQEIAIDLGTANTLIIHNDEVVVNEPSIVALDRNNPKNILAVGKKALMMHEKTHESIRTVRPLKDGVIADFNAAELMIREMIKMIYPKKPLFAPSWRMMICIPSSITEVEKRAVRDSAEQAGAKEVYLIHEPMAAALGIGIDVSWARIQHLSARLSLRLDAIEGVVVRDKGARQCGIVTFTIAGADAATVKDALARKDVTVNVTHRPFTLLDMTQRHIDSMARASVHYFNTDEEVDRAADVIASIARGSVERLR